MPLFITFGIYGSGKDTLAKYLLQANSEYQLLSGSRIMLRGLGFDVGITVDSPASKKMYQTLEQVSEKVKQQMADEVFKKTLLEFKQTGQVGILSSHLIIARREKDSIFYERNLIRSWFPEVFDGFIFVKGSPEQIYNRHLKDVQENTRDRGFSSIESLKKQQDLSDQEWLKLQHMTEKSKLKTIYNLDGTLERSAQVLYSFIQYRLNQELEISQEFKSQFKSI